MAAPVLRAGLDGLADAPRPGRPRKFPARVVAEVKALACELPAASGTPLARWTCPELARHAAASGITPAVSASTVRRWLADDAVKPWQHRSWIFPRDPHFAVKAGRVLDLYQREWEGESLGEGEYVLSADEKPGVQARMRIHLPLPPGPGRAMRAESEYARCGTLAYLAAYDVHRARVMGRCEPTTGIKPFTALVDQVMAAEPYASAKRVFWVVDNGASHRNWAAAARLSDAYPNAQMVHLPVHASWLNQRSTSPSSSASSSPPTTSRTSMSSPPRSSPSKSTTTPPPGPSTGSSPAPTSTASWHASGSTTGTHRTRWPHEPDELTGAPTSCSKVDVVVGAGQWPTAVG